MSDICKYCHEYEHTKDCPYILAETVSIDIEKLKIDAVEIVLDIGPLGGGGVLYDFCIFCGSYDDELHNRGCVWLRATIAKIQELFY